ncbi:MAG: hypothetical protein U0793_19025 [Gemmataceae bacterium]
MTTGNGEPSYFLSISGALRAHIRELAAEAKARGIAVNLRNSLVEILRRLEKDPNEFGEPSHGMPNSPLKVRRGALAPLHVRYAVHEEKRTVILLNIRMLAF